MLPVGVGVRVIFSMFLAAFPLPREVSVRSFNPSAQHVFGLTPVSSIVVPLRTAPPPSRLAPVIRTMLLSLHSRRQVDVDLRVVRMLIVSEWR